MRTKANTEGVDTTPISSGGAAPLAPGGKLRVVTSGDIAVMFQKHVEAI